MHVGNNYITMTTSLGVLYATSVFLHILPSLLVGYIFLRKIMTLVDDEHSHFRKETCCSLPVGTVVIPPNSSSVTK